MYSTMQFHGFHSMKRCRFAESDIYPQTSNKKTCSAKLKLCLFTYFMPTAYLYVCSIGTYFKGIPHFLASHDVT